jgi:hypothetical protein
VDEPSPRIREDQEDVEYAKRRGWNGEEIRGDDILGVVRQERPSTLRGTLSVTNHVLRDRGLADLDSELEEFTMNPRCTPEGIVA